ncbi:MAG: tRNA (adenosine(37)-N6)-threonylcarbamoyltransferase complex ATPase subunit type 1 TsaE [Candidatus Goldiibacteriota bacterium]
MEAFLKEFRPVDGIKSVSPGQTIEFAAKTAGEIHAGDIIAFWGDLGAGKTHFIKGMASFWGISEDEVISPTFGIVKEYAGRDMSLYHFDFYRILDSKELDTIGFRDYIADTEAVTAVEWPERAPDLFDIYTAAVVIKHESVSSRSIEVYRKI